MLGGGDMATLVIDNLDEDVVARFKALADEQGVSLEAFQRQVIMNVLEKSDDANERMANRPRNLHEALLRIPKSDDDEDIFAREDSIMRDIDWSE